MDWHDFEERIKNHNLNNIPKYSPYDIIKIIGDDQGLHEFFRIEFVDSLKYLEGLAKYDSILVEQNNGDDIYTILSTACQHITESGFILLNKVLPIDDDRTGYIGIMRFISEHPDYNYSTLYDVDMMIIRKGFNQISIPELSFSWNDIIYNFEDWFNPVLTDVYLFPYLTNKESKTRYKYSVLTCIFNGYEIVRDPINPNPEVEYILVTDDPNIKSNVWKVVLIDSYFKDFSGYAKTSYVKYHPFEYVTTDSVVWIDGSVLITNDFTDEIMLPFLRSNAEVFEFNNIVTDDCVAEMDRWVEQGFHGYNQDQYNISKSIFDKEPQYNNGQVQTTIYGCKDTKLTRKINDMTYDMLMRFRADKDVLILYMPQRSYLINKFFVGTDKIWFINCYEMFGRFFQYCEHGSLESQKEGWESWGHTINCDRNNKEYAVFGGRNINLLKFGNDN